MSNKRIKLLIIAGGGIFGAIPARFLMEAEDLYNTHTITHLAGTSIGGIEALYLATGKSPTSLYRDFCEAAPEIFKPRLIKRIFPLWKGGTYESKNIESFLQKCIPGKMGALSKKVIVPAVNFKLEIPKVFHNLDGSIDLYYDAWKVGRATSAAPTYFDPYSQDILIDGGIIENIPLMTSIAVLKSTERVKLEDIDVFIIGTGSQDVDASKTLKTVSGYWPWEWASKMLLPFVTKANEIASEHWGENMGFHYFKYYNPIVINGAMDDVELITSGYLNECCDSRIGEFRQEFKKFLEA
jgi:patatin-like phospholipase/acyl hydrolase